MLQLSNRLAGTVRVFRGSAACGGVLKHLRLGRRRPGKNAACSRRLLSRGCGLFRPGPGALGAVLALLQLNSLSGQGVNQPVVMHTGLGNPLSSQSVSVTGTSILTLDFGFATDEQPQPGLIPDSFTISISGPDGTGYLVTLDATGTHWTPFVPGALAVDTSSLQWQAAPFLASAEGLTNSASYTLGYTLPSNWQGAPLSVNFDLFDNQNPLRSLAYFLVPVPEPSAAALAVLALALWWRAAQVRFAARRGGNRIQPQ